MRCRLALRYHARGSLPCRRTDCARSHQQSRARQLAGHRAGRLRAHPQSVGPRSRARWLERWRSGRSRSGDGADRARLRWRRIDPNPGLVLRVDRAQTVAGTDHARPAATENSLLVELCVSRSVRDTALLLDAVQGPGVGDTVIAPSPRRLYSDEVAADPGGCGSACSTTFQAVACCTTIVSSPFVRLPRCSNHLATTSPPSIRHRSPTSRSRGTSWRCGA